MSLGRYIKEEMKRVFEEKINRSRAIILCSAQGLKAVEMVELREKIDKEETDFFLIKKRLASMTFQKRELDITPFLEGDTFYAVSRDDPIRMSKILVDFAKSHEALKIKGGVIDKKIVGTDAIKRYASLPSKEILLQQLIFRIKAPMSNLALLLEIPLRKLILTVKAIGEAKK